MDTNKKIARTVGALFIITMLIGLITSTLIAPMLYAPLNTIYPNKIWIITGALFDMIMFTGAAAIAVVLFPILKKQNEIIAVAYVALRAVECAMFTVGVIISLLLIPLSQEFIKAGSLDASYFQTLGILAIKGRSFAFQIAMIFISIGGLLLCYLLYKSRLIPRFISIVGLVGYALLAVSAVLDIYGIIDTVHGAGIYMYIPGSIFELILFPIWLIIKGFNPSAIVSESSKLDKAK